MTVVPSSSKDKRRRKSFKEKEVLWKALPHWVVHRAVCNLSLEEKVFFKGITSEKVIAMACELNVQPIFAWHTWWEHLRAQLLWRSLGFEGKQGDESLFGGGIEGRRRVKKKALAALTEAHNSNPQLQRANDDLKLQLQHMGGAKLIKENEYFGGEVYNEHIKSFHKGITQCAHFLDIPTDYEGYDVMKIVVDGKLLDIPSVGYTERPYWANSPSQCQFLLGSRPNASRVKFSPTGNFTFTPNLSIRAPFQVPPPLSQSSKTTGRLRQTQSVRSRTRRSRQKDRRRRHQGQSLRSQNIHRNILAPTVGPLEESRQALGINITNSDQHQEFSTKHKLHNMDHYLYMEHLQQDKKIGLPLSPLPLWAKGFPFQIEIFLHEEKGQAFFPSGIPLKHNMIDQEPDDSHTDASTTRFPSNVQLSQGSCTVPQSDTGAGPFNYQTMRSKTPPISTEPAQLLNLPHTMSPYTACSPRLTDSEGHGRCHLSPYGGYLHLRKITKAVTSQPSDCCDFGKCTISFQVIKPVRPEIVSQETRCTRQS
ncbi:hypothetical protein V8G54_016589 [Vigna mungo]|uniref:Uncharacterized protein n=1 Tax=Vigna mungo TaxID=3915 RepID=A0AAQ3NKF7_VIGMU